MSISNWIWPAKPVWMVGAVPGRGGGRGHALRPLTAWQRWMNPALAPIRGQVERAFGTPKRSCGWRHVRCRGPLRSSTLLHLPCTAMNRRRAERRIA